jgi:hypothetical protein
MFCRPCFNRFWGLKYIPRLFSEYMLTFRAEEPMKLNDTQVYLYFILHVPFDNHHHLIEN